MSEKTKAITFGAVEPSVEAARNKALQLISAFKLDKSVAKQSIHYPRVDKSDVTKGLESAINESHDSIYQGYS